MISTPNHSAVLLTIDSTPPNKPQKHSLTQGLMDWATFRSFLENKINLNIRLKCSNDIDEAVHFPAILNPCMKQHGLAHPPSSLTPKNFSLYQTTNI